MKKIIWFYNFFWTNLSFRTRLTGLISFVIGSVLIIFGISIYSYLQYTLQKEFDDALYNYAVDVLDSVSITSTGDLEVGAAQFDREKVYPFSLGDASIQIRHISGQLLVKFGEGDSLQIPFKSDFNKIKTGADFVLGSFDQGYSTQNNFWLLRLFESKKNSYRSISIVIDDSPQPQLILQVAVPLYFLQSQIESRRWIFTFGLPLTLVAIVFMSFILASQAIKPVHTITRLTKTMEAKNLSSLLPIPKHHDEFYMLVESINGLLQRLAAAFKSQEEFVANASHQLFTPITILRGEIESSLINNEEKSSLIKQVDHLANLIKDMLILASIDSGLSENQMKKIQFAEVVLEAVRQLESLAKLKNIRLVTQFLGQVESSSEVFGDFGLLQNLIKNLIENAIKYSPFDSVVTIHLTWLETHLRLEISDQGTGLKSDKKLFERFNRGTTAPSEVGFGLGLSIAQKIAQSHGAQIVAKNLDSGGAQFLLEIKKI